MMTVKTIRVLWDGSNAIRKKVLYTWTVDDTINKSFKRYCNMKAGKEAIRTAAHDYIVKAVKENTFMNIGAEFLDAYVINDMLYIDVETDENKIASVLSFQCNSNLWFEEVTFQHLRSM